MIFSKLPIGLILVHYSLYLDINRRAFYTKMQAEDAGVPHALQQVQPRPGPVLRRLSVHEVGSCRNPSKHVAVACGRESVQCSPVPESWRIRDYIRCLHEKILWKIKKISITHRNWQLLLVKSFSVDEPWIFFFFFCDSVGLFLMCHGCGGIHPVSSAWRRW